MTPPRWPVVLFDLDGTLADTIGLIVASYNHALSAVIGETRPEEEIRSWIGRSLLDSFVAISPDHAEELDRVYREWNLANTAALLREYPGVPGLLDDLDAAGVRTGVVTSKRRETALVALRGVGIDQSIDLLAGLEDTDQHKPHPAPLLHGLERLGADPGDAVYIGDAAVDVLAAQAAGVSAIGVTWGAGHRADLEAARPLALVDSVDELKRVLLGEAAA